MSEYGTIINGLKITVDKDGGGSPARAYEGAWTVSVMNGPVYVFDNACMTTGTPKTHEQVALLAEEFAQEDIAHAMMGEVSA